MKIYTKKGDKGETSLLGQSGLLKSDIRISAYGQVDELNAHIGLLIASITDFPQNTNITHLSICLKDIQHHLFTVGSHLSCVHTTQLKTLPPLQEAWIKSLEQHIDSMSEHLHPLKNFILPGGCKAACQSHLCRTICRRAERTCVDLHSRQPIHPVILAYLNRMSDYFFILSRYINAMHNIPDVLWQKKSADNVNMKGID